MTQKQNTTKKKEKRVKGWAAVDFDTYADHSVDSYLVDVEEEVLDFYAVFRTKKDAELYSKLIGLKVLPVTITYSLPITPKKYK